ncbi:MAG: SUMF1/EgtB/PvdO family nonheme iron enzyme, partial [Lentisphaeria bacterium]|nr:SUMF1/EgtB/PvdO family nonheme iron enzyme [Lentisphaeria bacterium]
KTQFKVALDVPLLVGRFEVTRRDWGRVFGHLPEGAPPCADDCPVTKVNFFDAVAYCNARSKKDKLPECYEMSNCRGSRGEGGMQCAKVSMKSSQCSGYRLPTAGEWDFLAAIAHPKGLDAALLDHIAWHQGNGQRRLHPVGSLDQDSLGLHDLIGNAGEWVDPWAASKARPKDADIERNTLIPVRGGSAWTAFDNGGSVEDSKEFAEVPDASTGFRLVRTVP